MERHQRGVELLQRGLRCGRRQQLEEGVLYLVEGLGYLDARRDPRLLLCGTHNLALYLAHLGLPKLAGAVLAGSRGLHRRLADPLLAARRLWLRGTIERIAGRTAQAVGLLTDARKKFTELGETNTATTIGKELETLGDDLAEVRAA